jgi:hypothetical protein
MGELDMEVLLAERARADAKAREARKIKHPEETGG